MVGWIYDGLCYGHLIHNVDVVNYVPWIEYALLLSRDEIFMAITVILGILTILLVNSYFERHTKTRLSVFRAILCLTWVILGGIYLTGFNFVYWFSGVLCGCVFMTIFIFSDENISFNERRCKD